MTRYYTVSIGLDRHWKNSEFTYSSTEKLPIQSVVVVPFGKRKVPGVITGEVAKPTFETKEILSLTSIGLHENYITFMSWYKNYYGLNTAQYTKQLLPSFLSVRTNEQTKEASKPIDIILPNLNKAQKQVVDAINIATRPIALHGVTGSGKTRVYIAAIHTQIKKRNKSALLLLPEISLTPQVINEFSNYFEHTIVFHSQLTESQKRKAWKKISESEKPVVIIGTRSSLFLPIRNLGIIIIDEAHDSSYSQDSGNRYNGLYVAGGLAKAHNATLVLGSATLPITETYQLLKNSGTLHCMHARAVEGTKEPSIVMIDMRKRENFTQHPKISNELIHQARKALQDKKQVLLFINRRGTAKITLCSNCDWQDDCPRCDLPLTLHHDVQKMICHTCGYTKKPEYVCPQCHSKTEIKNLGSKALEVDIKKLFPHAAISRFDSDNSKEENFISQHTKIMNGEIDIILGTQQIGKGLDIPNLAVVGVLDADLSLHFPDYTSDEKTFQLITQVIGRVGRRKHASNVIIQTHQPKNEILYLAQKQDWHTFMDRELAIRKNHNFPPFTHISKLTFREKVEQKAIKTAESTKQAISNNNDVLIDGPIPAYIPKKGGYFYYELHISSKSRTKNIKAIIKAPSEAIVEIDTSTLL